MNEVGTLELSCQSTRDHGAGSSNTAFAKRPTSEGQLATEHDEMSMNNALLKIYSAVDIPSPYICRSGGVSGSGPFRGCFTNPSEPARRRGQPRRDSGSGKSTPGADYVTLHADRDDFHVSLPLEALKGQGIVVYKQGSDVLGVEHGGPIRLIIRDPAACHTGELDDSPT